MIAQYAPEYDKMPSDDSPPWGLRKNVEHAELRSVILRKKSSQLYGGIVVHHRIEIHAYSFARKEDRERALQGWLGCFGTLCDPLTIHSGTGYTKSPPLLALVHDTNILILK
jgi:hypothetical protein